MKEVVRVRGIEELQPTTDMLTEPRPTAPAGPAPLAPERPGHGLDRDEHAARRTLRRQVARLEQQLSQAIVVDLRAGARGRLQTDVFVDRSTGPRLLDLGGLEARRDELIARLVEVEERREEELRNQELLREMYRDPASHRGRRLETADLAERGCKVYEVKPVLGFIGILGGWWRVKVSSGCPLASAPRAPNSGGR